MNFGEILNNLMREEDVTQAELAKSIGYTQRAVSKWVNCQSEPTEKAIVKCANFFQVSTDYLLGLEDDFGARLAPIHSDDTNLTTEERQLIEDFRKLNYYKQKLIKDNIKAMLPAEAESEQKKKKA